MKRKASELTMEQKEAKQYKNRRYVSFSKRRSGLFRKGEAFCKNFEAEIGMVVLSEAGRAYWSPDNPSFDAVLDRFMQSDQAPANAIDFKVRRRKKRKRESVGEEQDNVVQGQLAEEVKGCRTVEDMFSLRDKYLVLLQDYTNKRMKASPVLEKGKAKCVSTSPSNQSFEDSVPVEPISRHKDICSSSTQKLDSEHDHRLGNNNGSGGHHDGQFWIEILEDNATQGVVMEPISKSEDVLHDSTLNFESGRNVFDAYHGNINGGEGSYWCKDWAQPISKSEEVLYNSTLNLESDHNVFTDHHGSNNDDDGTFWDRVLEYDKTHPLANSEDVLFNSTSNFECDHLNNNNDGDNDKSFWDKILEEGKSQCVPLQPISESKEFLYNPSLNFESDHCLFDHYQGDNNGGRVLCWNEDWEHGKVECVSTQPISKYEDIGANTTLNFESNHDHVHGGNNVKDGEGCLLDKDLEKTGEVIKETNHSLWDPIEEYEVDGVFALRGTVGSSLDFTEQNPNPNPNPNPSPNPNPYPNPSPNSNPNPNDYYSYLENLCNVDTFDYLL